MTHNESEAAAESVIGHQGAVSVHTPGPWKARKVLNRTFVYDANDCTVCTVARWTPRNERDNARLLAAAPEMLSLLRRVFQSAKLPPKLEQDVSAIIRKVDGA